MIVGINTFLWTTDWQDGAEGILSNIKQLGFDAVQIPLLSLHSSGSVRAFDIAKDLGLLCFVSAGLKDEMDVTSNSPDTRRRGVDFLKQCVHIASRVGGPFLSGSFHSVFGKRSQGLVTHNEWWHSANSLKEVAKEAGDCGLDIVLEPINRYESFLVNTVGQARHLMAMIDEPNVKLQLDTFHMNLEEPDFRSAIISAGKDLVHFHVAENHRGRFGYGMMPWDDIFEALAEIEYKGAVVIESFVPEVPEVATAACVWRQMAPSADCLAQEGLEFIRKVADRHGL